MTDLLIGPLRRLRHRIGGWIVAPPRDERGDVPGWVLITIMSAGIVVVLMGVAKTELTSLFTTAVNSIK